MDELIGESCVNFQVILPQNLVLTKFCGGA